MFICGEKGFELCEFQQFVQVILSETAKSINNYIEQNMSDTVNSSWVI